MPDNPRFRIYPPLGITRLGNGPADKDQVIFSPEVPWANLYETKNDYLTDSGHIKKQAQRFYIYECDDKGLPIKQINPADYDIEWSVEVANKKPFWYVFNNCLDLSVKFENQNLSPNFFDEKLAPGISAAYRNPNVLTKQMRDPKIANYRKELVNHPGKISVNAWERRRKIEGQFPDPGKGKASKVLQMMNASGAEVNLGILEYEEEGTLIFYPADGKSAALNPSDLNTDFADNSNWYDDICDGRVTAILRPKGGSEVLIELTDAKSAAWVASTPPDYAPQIQPISTMFDMVAGTANDTYTSDMSLVFPFMYRLYRMQWVNLGDFLAPSFKESIDELIANHEFKYLYTNDGSDKAKEVRQSVFDLFRNPQYPFNNEPIIPSKDMTNIVNAGDETKELQMPFYPGDAIDYPGSPAQWFAIPPLLYDQLVKWNNGDFETVPGDFAGMDDLGKHYQREFKNAADNESIRPLLMTRAILETLYGGGFHPGVELTWPMRHKQMYAQNDLITEEQTGLKGLFGLREIRMNAASEERQQDIFYNDFGLRMNATDVQESLDPKSKKHWLWEATPGDLTKWMGIPWQSDAGSCQAVFTESQYPTPAWWAANLPVDVLPEDGYDNMQKEGITEETKRSIFASRLPWLQTTNTGFVGYHAEGGYTNGLIAMVYKWKDIGMVTGREMKNPVDGVPDVVYVAENGPQRAKKKKK